MVVSADATVATGNLFTVEVDISGLSTAAVGVRPIRSPCPTTWSSPSPVRTANARIVAAQYRVE